MLRNSVHSLSSKSKNVLVYIHTVTVSFESRITCSFQSLRGVIRGCRGRGREEDDLVGCHGDGVMDGSLSLTAASPKNPAAAAAKKMSLPDCNERCPGVFHHREGCFGRREGTTHKLSTRTGHNARHSKPACFGVTTSRRQITATAWKGGSWRPTSATSEAREQAVSQPSRAS